MRGHRSTLAKKRRRDFVTLQPSRDFRRHLRPHVVYLQFKRVSITLRLLIIINYAFINNQLRSLVDLSRIPTCRQFLLIEMTRIFLPAVRPPLRFASRPVPLEC